MKECNFCKHAEWDCFEFYNTTQKKCFVCSCNVGGNPEEDGCELFEEEEEWKKE